jgi:TRAP-type C4-dicarboxylate transport system permease small subunit
LDDAFAGLALFICFVLVCFQVGARMLHVSVSWTDELSRYLIIVSTYFGACAAVRTRDHIRVELVLGLLPKGLRSKIEVAVPLLCALYCAVITVAGYHWLEDTIALGLVSAESSLVIPIWVFQMVIPFGFGLMGLRFVAQAWEVAKTGHAGPLSDAPVPLH